MFELCPAPAGVPSSAPTDSWPELDTAALEVLRTSCVAPAGPLDSGLGVLIGIAASSGGPSAPLVGPIARWLTDFNRNPGHDGLFGRGLSGLLIGLVQAQAADPRLPRLLQSTRSRLVTACEQRPWRGQQLDWADYDLIYGPAGIALALIAAGCSAADLEPIANHLCKLCDPDLTGLVVGVAHPTERRGRNLGRINTGLAHGSAGVLAALIGIVRTHGRREDLLEAIGNAARWLMSVSYLDDQGLLGWPAMYCAADSLPRTAPEQVWCYGGPGIAWQLWEAGQLLDEPALTSFALQILDALATSWDPDRYLRMDTPGSELSICHGAAGVLAIMDAFTVHTGHDGAARLRSMLTARLAGRLDQVIALAQLDVSTLTGAAGILAVLHTVRGGNRGWLLQLGLR